MPKRVDPQQQRRVVVDALGRLALREGLTGVTMRQVAAEAGVSVGFVQHYFASKDELLLAALLEVAGRVARRLEAAMAALGPDTSERDRLRVTLLAFLPLDDEGRTAAVLFRAFDAGGVNDASTTGPDAAVVPRGFDAIVRRRLEAARLAGELRADVEIDHEALTYLMAVLGLGDGLLSGLLTPARATEVVDYILRRSFIG